MSDSETLQLLNKLQKLIIDFKVTPKQAPAVIPPKQAPAVIPDLDRPSDMILKLVSIAENSSADWKKQINYIENINDDRGYTISIVGFCTGTGDFIQVLQEIKKIDPVHPLVKFIPIVKEKSGGDVSGLSGLPKSIHDMGIDDPVFNKAMWIIIKKLYWGPSLQFCKSKNLVSNLSKYIAYDTCINFGELDIFNKLEVAKNDVDEKVILKKFLDIKQTTIENGNYGSSKGARTDMQKLMLSKNNMNLVTGFSVTCYGDTFKL